MDTHARSRRPPASPATHLLFSAARSRWLQQRARGAARGAHLREAAAILRVGRNQLYQAVARGELGAVRIGGSIRIPKQTLLDLLTAASPPTANGDE